MIELLACGETLPEAYHEALVKLYKFGDVVEDNDHDTLCKEVSMTMQVFKPLAEPMISRMVPCGPYDLERYRLEMLDGIMDFNVGHGWDYTYHDRMTSWYAGGEVIDQVEFVVDELNRNKTTRRAVIDVRNNAEDVYSSDPACLQHIEYFARGSRLDCCVTFRSNDAVRAAYMNAFALIKLQERIAGKLGLKVGTYSHRANSFHAYETSWDLLESYVKRAESGEDTTYDFAGDWEIQMEEARPIILEEVKKLHERSRSY